MLAEGTTETALVKALQCLLKEQSLYGGKLNGTYNEKTIAAANAWQTGHGFTASADLGPRALDEPAGRGRLARC